jgi:hypothetical protein
MENIQEDFSDKPAADDTEQAFLIITDDGENESPFLTNPALGAVLPKATEGELLQALDNIYSAIIGQEVRGLVGAPKNFDIMMINDSTQVRLVKTAKTPLSVSVTTVGFYA